MVFKLNVGAKGRKAEILSRRDSNVAAKSPRVSDDGKTMIW